MSSMTWRSQFYEDDESSCKSIRCGRGKALALFLLCFDWGIFAATLVGWSLIYYDVVWHPHNKNGEQELEWPAYILPVSSLVAAFSLTISYIANRDRGCRKSKFLLLFVFGFAIASVIVSVVGLLVNMSHINSQTHGLCFKEIKDYTCSILPDSEVLACGGDLRRYCVRTISGFALAFVGSLLLALTSTCGFVHAAWNVCKRCFETEEVIVEAERLFVFSSAEHA